MTHTEARELANKFGSRMCDENGDTHGEELYCFSLDDIIALKEALAQPEQEPVATVTSETGADITMSWWHEPALPIGTKLYTTPPQRTEPVIDKSAAKRIATTLGWTPQRTWVDLPDEEIKILWIQYRAALPRYLCFAKALLSIAKEKNT